MEEVLPNSKESNSKIIVLVQIQRNLVRVVGICLVHRLYLMIIRFCNLIEVSKELSSLKKSLMKSLMC